MSSWRGTNCSPATRRNSSTELLRTDMTTEFWTILGASIVGVFGVARLTRLTSEDSFPPVAAARDWWVAKFNRSGWAELGFCPFCQAPYHAAIALAWGWLSDLHWSWWAFY